MVEISWDATHCVSEACKVIQLGVTAHAKLQGIYQYTNFVVMLFAYLGNLLIIVFGTWNKGINLSIEYIKYYITVYDHILNT